MSNTRYIAIADDHSLFRKGLISLIDFFPDYEILFDAANGDEFIKMLKPSSLPDIALLDINMPVMDGYRTAEWLRVNYPKVNVLALSTMEDETSIIKMIKHGAKGYVLKDAEPAELKLAFDEILTKGFFYNDLLTKKVMQTINLLTDQKSEMHTLLSLSSKEIEFLKLACTEKNYHEIANEMFLSHRTIDGYRNTLFKKLNVTTRVGLVMYAVRNKIVTV
ncbi:MAG TPA: response regulator transcription factor [Segetibacter sp.]|jgi:DNA-binding NarL/FixJ family response regulator